jgi:hypothetical protein
MSAAISVKKVACAMIIHLCTGFVHKKYSYVGTNENLDCELPVCFENKERLVVYDIKMYRKFLFGLQ